MTDFYAQLEEQLVAAGRRHQSQGRMRRAVAGRRRVLIASAAAIAVLVVAGAVALPWVLTTSSTSKPAAPPQVAPVPAVRALSLRGVDVAVRNGTTRTGAGRTVAAQLERLGARISAIESAGNQNVARTVVLYRNGARAAAVRVAAVLGGGTIVRPSGAKADGRVVAITVIVGAERRTATAARPVAPRAPALAVPAPRTVTAASSATPTTPAPSVVPPVARPVPPPTARAVAPSASTPPAPRAP